MGIVLLGWSIFRNKDVSFSELWIMEIFEVVVLFHSFS